MGILERTAWSALGRAIPTALRRLADRTFAARQSWLWGEGTTAVASDSTHFTEWHSHYRRGKRGVLIYWQVEPRGVMAVEVSKIPLTSGRSVR